MCGETCSEMGGEWRHKCQDGTRKEAKGQFSEEIVEVEAQQSQRKVIKKNTIDRVSIQNIHSVIYKHGIQSITDTHIPQSVFKKHSRENSPASLGCSCV